MVLVVLSLAWLGGITTVALWDAPAWLPGASLGLLLPLALQRWLPAPAWLVALAALVALAGALRFETWDEAPAPPLAAHVGQDVTATGTIRDLPRPGITVSRYEVDINAIHDGSGWEQTSGAAMITVGQYADYAVGSRVRVEGHLELPPILDDFDYRAYLARQGVVATMFYPEVSIDEAPSAWSLETIVGEARTRMERGLERALPEPAASVAAGISLGRPGNVPDQLYDDYRRAGLAHILAVSGAHVSVLSAIVFFALVQVLGRRRAIWPALAVVVAYVLLAGAPFSVVRAGIMASVFLVGIYLGRPQASLSALAAAAMAMTAWRPATALDVGFQLSLAATAGLIVFAPWIRALVGAVVERLRMRGVVPALAEHVVAFSLAASLATAPLLWVHFGQVPLISPLSNIMVEPIFGLAFALSLATAAAGAWSDTLGWALGLAAYYPVAGLSWTASAFGGLPFASVNVPEVSANWALLAYVVMAVPGWFAYRYLAPIPERPPMGRSERVVRRTALGSAAGAVAMLVAWHSLAPIGGPGELEVTVLDVGQGDAILVQAPGGETLLVDGGPSGIVLARELGEVLPHWKQGLDTVMVSHHDADHVGGVPALARRTDIATIRDSGFATEAGLYKTYDAALPGRQPTRAGDRLEVGDVAVNVLWPPTGEDADSANNQSLVLHIHYGETDILLTGDIEREAQQSLMETHALTGIDVLQVPHHGSATSSRRFFEQVDAGLAVISVGEDNTHGHPAPATLNQLDGTQVLRTDEHGRVTIRSDGTDIRVTTAR